MEIDQEREAILVVDDDLEVRAVVKVFLEQAGYAVATATDGEDGLNVFRSGRSRFALLLTDVRMPNMNGFDLADRVLELDSELPVLFMSGDAWNASRGLGCVAKPFTAVELVDRVHQGLEAWRKRQRHNSSAA
jgi:two-component system cell cycle sensor histidine kinase/response regulator CckA